MRNKVSLIILSVKAFIASFLCFPLLQLTALSASENSELWSYSTGLNLAMTVVAVEADQTYLFVAQKQGGVLVLAETADGEVSRVTSIRTRDLNTLHAMNLRVHGDILYVALGDHFSANGSRSGLAAISISNPMQPQVLSVWMSISKGSGAADVVVQNDIAYLAAMDQGIHILDISDSQSMTLLTTFRPDIHFPKPNPAQIALPRARGLAIRDSLLYIANDAGGLRIIDIGDPSNPTEIGQYYNPAMGDKPQAFNNVVIADSIAYLAVDYCGLEILDISEPANLRQLLWANPWECHAPTSIWFSSEGHTNEMVLDEWNQRLYLSGGDTDLIVVSIAKPTQPELITVFGHPRDGLGAWGLTAHNNKVYGGYIRTLIPFFGTWAGVKAFELP